MRLSGPRQPEAVDLRQWTLGVVTSMLCLGADGSVLVVSVLSRMNLSETQSCLEHHQDQLDAHTGPAGATFKLAGRLAEAQQNALSLQLFREKQVAGRAGFT